MHKIEVADTESARKHQTLDTYALVPGGPFNNTLSNFAIVRGVPSHNSMLTRSFTTVNKLERGEDTGAVLLCYALQVDLLPNVEGNRQPYGRRRPERVESSAIVRTC